METADNLVERGQEAMVNTVGFAATPVAAVVDGVLQYLSDNPQVDALVQSQINKALPALADNPSVQALVRSQVEQIMPYLLHNAAIQELIRAQAHVYLAYLEEHPEEIEELVRLVGDDYIDYLNQYPAAVQTLIQGQSIGLAAEVRDEVRERTVTADSVLDTVVRHLLRLTPTSELPVPSEPVKRRAEYGRLPEDYIRKYPNGNE
jgi:cytochrome P450